MIGESEGNKELAIRKQPRIMLGEWGGEAGEVGRGGAGGSAVKM